MLPSSERRQLSGAVFLSSLVLAFYLYSLHKGRQNKETVLLNLIMSTVPLFRESRARSGR